MIHSYLLGEEIYAALRSLLSSISTGVAAASVSGTTVTFTMIDGSTVTMEYPDIDPGTTITKFEPKDGTKIYLEQSDGTSFECAIPGTGITREILAKCTVGGVDEGTDYEVGYSLEQIVREILEGKNPIEALITSDKDDQLLRDITDDSTYVDTVKYEYGARYEQPISLVEFMNKEGMTLDSQDNPDSEEMFPYTANLASKFPVPSHTLAECAANDDFCKIIYKCHAVAEDGSEGSTIHTIEWIWPHYWILTEGSEAEQDAKTIDTLTADYIKTWNRNIVKNKSDFLSNLTTEYGRIGFAYPAKYGPLVSVRDAQNFECLPTYSSKTIKVDECDMLVYWSVYPMSFEKAVQSFT